MKSGEIKLAKETSNSIGVYDKLTAWFKAGDISWKINNYTGDKTKAMITFHVDARAVQNRLNEIYGVTGWSFKAEALAKDRSVKGRLTVGSSYKEDVGYPNDPKKDQVYKDAFSDALKRCAVHYGIGMYLYRLDNLWVELDLEQQSRLKQKQSIYLTTEQDKQIKAFYNKQFRTKFSNET